MTSVASVRVSPRDGIARILQFHVLDPLPVDEFVPAIREALERRRAVVVTAAPGAGKTTRVPPALVEDGAVFLLEPRRVAARAIARRIAAERRWTVGEEIGWQVRFERQFSDQTRLLVATEGVLTSRVQQDPLLTAFRTIVLDEFHERSIHADLGLALAKQAWLARSDLRLVVMSATMDAARAAAFLDDCPIVEVQGGAYDVTVGYRPGFEMDEAILEAWPSAGRSVLGFLPGAGEIRRTAERLASRLPADAAVLPLHGGLSPDEQDAAIRPSRGRRVILATNIAETSLTVPDVTCVVDAGLQKVARYDPARAIDSLETERISQDAADQRSGRAGRTGPGRAVRLWDARDRLRAHREPDIARIDLSAVLLDLLAWGADPATFAWFEPPPEAAVSGAVTLLRRLGAVDDHGRLTDTGRALQRLPLPPRLARILLEARGATVAARACALLSERGATLPRHQSTSCDLLAAADRTGDLPPHVVAVARDVQRMARDVLGGHARDRITDDEFRRAVLAGYPDRVARRRQARGDSLVLFSGAGARLARESGVVDAEFLVAVEMRGQVGTAAEPLVRIATGIERDWLRPTGVEVVHAFDEAAGIVRATERQMYGAVALKERPVPPDPVEAERLLADAYVRRGPRPEDEALLNRLRCAGMTANFEVLARASAAGAKRLDDIDLERGLDDEARRRLARDAPAMVALQNGERLRVEYRGDGRPIVSVRIQKVFGVTETLRLGPKRTPVTFELLAPNGRPVQVTSDLASFWTKVYPEIRGPLKARYPKHQW